MALSSKERIGLAIKHRQPDRIPSFSSFTPRLANRLRKDLGIVEADVGIHLGNDMVQVGIGVEKSNNYSDAPEYICPWGIGWRNVKNQFGTYTEIVGNPLAGDEEKLNRWNIPDPTEKNQYAAMRAMLDRYGDRYWIAGSCRCSLFETAWFLRGLDQFMVDLLINEDYVNALLDKIMEFPRTALKEFIRMGADMVWMGDDVATQLGMMISPEVWRKYFKPRYARLFKEFKEANPDIVIAYHSCGNCSAIVEELIEIGLDVLHPVQPMAIDPITTKRRFGDRLTLMGALDIQLLMPNGSPEDVRAEAVRLMRGCGENGGFIIGGAHHYQEDTSNENILALYRAVKEEGDYAKLVFGSVEPSKDAFERLKANLQK